MADIITLAEYKTVKGITDTGADIQLQAIIPMVCEFIESYCNRQFGIGNFEEQGEGIVDYQGRFFFRTKNRPIAEVFTLGIKFYGTQQTIPLDVTKLDLFKKDGYMYYCYAYDNLTSVTRDEYRDNFYYTITYSGGMNVPQAVKLAAITAISDMFEALNASKVVSGEVTNKELKSVKIGDYSESYETSSSIFKQLHDKSSGILKTPTILDLLNPYVYRGQSW